MSVSRLNETKQSLTRFLWTVLQQYGNANLCPHVS